MIDINLKKFQEDAVDFLYENTAYLNNNSKIVFQSPTGSGKTIILIAYIEKFLEQHKDFVFCWFTPGKGELEEQSKNKMEKYVRDLNTGDLSSVLTSGFNSGTTYFINWEAITKSDNIAVSPSEKNNIFDRIREAHNNQINFIVIIDEEHQNNTSNAYEVINKLNPKFEIRVSATPTSNANSVYYEIPEKDVICEELITKYMCINQGLETVDLIDAFHEVDILLESAEKVRNEIAEAYLEEEEDINPLVLVQFPNLNDELIDYVEHKLESMGYSYQNGYLASWFSAETKKDKEWKSKKLCKINIGTSPENSITKLNATPRFLLFKQALATGWDCPRAKILVKLRENMDETFEIQTLGRLRRMPKARHYGRDILDCCYLFTFDEKYKLKVLESGNAFEVQKVYIKEEAKNIKLVKELRNFDADFADERKIRNSTYNFFINKYKLTSNKKENIKKLDTQDFIINTLLTKKYLIGKYATYYDIKEEDVSYNDLTIEVDTHSHGIELQHNIDRIKKYIGLPYNKTSIILKTLFLKNFGNKQYKLLNLSLKEYYAFIINNGDKLKNDFLEFSGKRYEQVQFLHNKIQDFKIPREEYYRFDPNENNINILNKNVYNEYNTSMITDYFRSKSERLFEKYCEACDNVKYYYKNGDKGQQYLSIVYGTYFEGQRLFYPDYILQLTDESIWLIETKGGESKGHSSNIDNQVENKFDAFKRFAENYKYKFGFVRDRNEELYINNTEYVEEMSSEEGKIHWKPLKDVLK